MTSQSPLDRLAGPGNVLAKEPPDAEEFAGLVRSGSGAAEGCREDSNSLESRFDLAYSAAHALCLAALRHRGYRSSKRYIVFQVLPDTLGLGPEVWRVLSKCHDMRNRTDTRARSTSTSGWRGLDRCVPQSGGKVESFRRSRKSRHKLFGHRR